MKNGNTPLPCKEGQKVTSRGEAEAAPSEVSNGPSVHFHVGRRSTAETLEGPAPPAGLRPYCTGQPLLGSPCPCFKKKEKIQFSPCRFMASVAAKEPIPHREAHGEKSQIPFQAIQRSKTFENMIPNPCWCQGGRVSSMNIKVDRRLSSQFYSSPFCPRSEQSWGSALARQSETVNSESRSPFHAPFKRLCLPRGCLETNISIRSIFKREFH